MSDRKVIPYLVSAASYIVVVAIVTITRVLNTCFNAAPTEYFNFFDRRDEVSDRIWGIINGENPYRCHDLYRMDGYLFRKLMDTLKDYVPITRKLPLHIQVAIYLDWIAHYPTLRVQKSNFKVSHELLIKARTNITKAVIKALYPRYVRPAREAPSFLFDEKRKFFQNCYGCIDGSYLPIIVPSQEKENWLCRKDFTATNALLVSDIEGNLTFQYAMFGAEGPGSDSLVLRHATTMDLIFMKNCYLLGDGGYGLSRHILTPYRGVRYHLKEFQAGNPLGRPNNREELFNLRHASLRNQVERAFGVMKKRFRIMRDPLDLAEKKDLWKTYYSCVAVHNFIRIENCNLDKGFENEVIQEILSEKYEAPEHELFDEDDIEAGEWRDLIAEAMWIDYTQNHQ